MIAGPAVGGFIVVGAGPGWTVLINGVTYLMSVLLLAKVRISPAGQRSASTTSVLTELHAGWVYVRSCQWLVIGIATASFILAAHRGCLYTLGPVLAQRSSVGERGWGFILAGEAVGMVLTGLVVLRLRIERPLMYGMVGASLYGLPLITLGTRPEVALGIAAAIIAGAGIEVFSLGWNLAMQEQVPERMLSRVSSFDTLGSFAVVPIGQVFAGPLASSFGLQRVMILAGVTIGVVPLVALVSTAVRDMGRADELPHQRG
jgi:hypothetical protein